MTQFAQRITLAFNIGTQFSIELASAGDGGPTEMWMVVSDKQKGVQRVGLPPQYGQTAEAFQAAIQFIKGYPGLRYDALIDYSNPLGVAVLPVAKQREILEFFDLSTPINVVAKAI